MTETEAVRLARIEERLDALNSKLDGIAEGVRAMALDCPAHRAAIATLEARITNIEEHTIPGLQQNARELYNRNWAAAISALIALGTALISILSKR